MEAETTVNATAATADSGARSIRTAVEHETALRRIEAIWDSEIDEEKSELDALVTLVDHYERERFPLAADLDPVDMIKHAMSSDVGHSRQELIALVGAPSRASEILLRKRPLTLDMIRAISAAWGIPVECLTPAYRLDTSDTRKEATPVRRAPAMRL